MTATGHSQGHAAARVERYDPCRGKTRIRVTCSGEEITHCIATGGPRRALATVASNYQRMAELGGLQPGLWRLVPDCGDADIDPIEIRVEDPNDPRAPRERPIGRASVLLTGLRPRGFAR